MVVNYPSRPRTPMYEPTPSEMRHGIDRGAAWNEGREGYLCFCGDDWFPTYREIREHAEARA